ncbi:MAG: NFACT family protein, partial [Planctomycetes bacterium]|nr:NFACT family protein [Planctomycetota bacterium]
ETAAADRSRNLSKVLRREAKNARRRLDKIESELAEADHADEYARHGELLKSVLGKISPGASEVRVPDYESGEEVTIPLDPKKSPKANLEATFKRYQKLLRRLAKAGGQVEKARDWLGFVELQLERVAEQSESESGEVRLAALQRIAAIDSVRKLLRKRIAAAIVPGSEDTKNKLPARLRDLPSRLIPRRYRSRDGLEIPGANDPWYAFVPVTPGDAGSYDVVVSNLCGTITSGTTTLTVNWCQANIQSAAGCGAHGGAGEFCLDYDANNIEPRSGPVTVVFELDGPVDSMVASVTCAEQVYTGSVTASVLNGTTVRVALDPLPNRDCCTVSLAGLVGDGIDIRPLTGDVNRNGSVNATDKNLVKGAINVDPVTDLNFIYDVNQSGMVNSTDKNMVKGWIGNQAPGCP